MDLDRLIDELPEPLAMAMRLHRSGEPDSVIAAGLGIPPEGVPTLLSLAQAKLQHLIDQCQVS